MTIFDLLAFDVDGVMTDGTLLYGAGGISQRFGAQDGAGLSELRKAGYRIALVSWRDLPSTRRRAMDLGIDLLALGCRDKASALEKICRHLGTVPGRALFMGDDLMDLPALRIAGYSVCPSNAHEEVRRECRLVTVKPGGAGAVREVADHVLSGRMP
ncbi:HAD hydrolase family protein [Candidatus Fermentibacteria bacterium]|nr:HAD hydrolase family protein [Candidatus Fermentibacteria bacterium]